MKIIIYSIILLAMLMPSYPAFADEDFFRQEISLQGQLAHVSGDEAKFDEYADTKNGVYGSYKLKFDSGEYYLHFNAADIGYKTQEYTLDGGRWGNFKYNLYYDETPHNITYDAKTFYSGAGDSSLVIKGNPSDVRTWSTFDYKTDRKRFGGGIDLDFIKPFFLNASAYTESKKGIIPTSYGDRLGIGDVVTELPGPIDYRTNTLRVEGGYSKKPFYASLSYDYSKFENNNHALDFFDNTISSPNSVSLPSDNSYYKLAFKGALFLPFNSKFSLNAGESRTKSDIGGNDILGLDPFTGRIDTKNLDLALTSNPASFINGKIFYKYYDRDNKSEGDEDHLGYTNNSYGGQLGFKLPAQFRLTVGYTNKATQYEDRYDAKKRTDDLYSAELAWSGLDFATLKVGYERLHRRLDRSGTDAVSDLDTLWRFDVAPADRDIFKASVDLSPFDNLSVTAGYKYKKTKYEDSALAYASTGLGLRDYESDEFFVDASYALAKFARLYGYFDFERALTQQFGYSSGDPDTTWKLNQKEKNFDYGIGAEFFIIPKKLTVKAQYDYVRSDGSADFTYLDMPTPSGVNMSDWGDYRKKAFSVKAIYDVNKSLSLTAGYVYEQYELNDIQLDGYQYLPDSNAYLTGAYKDPNYKANVVFLIIAYRF